MSRRTRNLLHIFVWNLVVEKDIISPFFPGIKLRGDRQRGNFKECKDLPFRRPMII